MPAPLDLPPILNTSSTKAKANAAATASANALLPGFTAEGTTPKEKSWKTTLAPTEVIPQTSFNYRRDALPSTIYRRNYADYNKHLPVAMTRQDYANMLFASATRNDVEATRALLNAGANINTVADNGETPLAAARKAGAMATTQLLLARGGH